MEGGGAITVIENFFFRNSTIPLILEDLPTDSGGKCLVIMRIFFLFCKLNPNKEKLNFINIDVPKILSVFIDLYRSEIFILKNIFYCSRIIEIKLVTFVNLPNSKRIFSIWIEILGYLM